MIPGDLLSAFPHRQFHTLPDLLDSWAALPNSIPNACMPMQGGSLYHFYNGLWYDPTERRTHDLPCERRTRYWLSQPDTVSKLNMYLNDYMGMIINAYRGAFWQGVQSDQNILTGNMFLVMRQNDFGHDQDRNFIRVFKYCYFLVNTYLQRVHLLNV